MKRTLLFAALAAGILSANAELTIIDNIQYNTDANTGTASVWSNNTLCSGDVVIPSTFVYNGTTYTVNELYMSAFDGNTAITSIVLPNTVTKVNNYAFDGCSALKSIDFGEGAYDLKNNLIDGCTSLTDIYIGYPSAFSLYAKTFNTDIKKNVNLHMASASAINSFLGLNGNWNGFKMYMTPDMTCVDGMYFKVNKENMTAMMMATYDMAVNIPGFSQSNLSGEAQKFGPEANVPSNVTIDGEEYTVTNLQAGAFYDTPNVTSVTFNEGLLNVEYETFYGTKVEEVVFPNSMENLENTNFYYCPNVKSVTFGTDMKTIGVGGFVGCPNLTAITCLASVPPTKAAGAAGNVFTADFKANATLTVPHGTSEDYKATEVWAGFKEYIELDSTETGIEGVETDDNAPARYFNLQGVEINEPAKGQIVIEVRGGKSTKRVIR